MLLLGLLFALFLAAEGQQCSVQNPRLDCGYSGMPQAKCIERKCCWDNTTAGPWCYFPGTSAANITTVHIIFSCHLDVGFLNLSSVIVNWYFDNYFPQAIATANSLKAKGGVERLIFTTHSYLVSLYLDCPLGFGLHCPDASAISTFTQALKDGDIVYHAYPFNTEPEVYDPLMLKYGVQMTHDLDTQLGLKAKNTLSQRDVPGMTRSVIPHLLEEGVVAVSVGVNGASTPPNVPRAFVWKEPSTGKSLLAMWHPFGYGGYSVADAVLVPGFDHALVFDWRGDNSGPPPESEVISVFAQVQSEFPGAKVIASDFDSFVNVLVSSPAMNNLPVFDVELGDTWIYGVPSDPWKTQQMRAISRARSDCINAQDPSCSDATFKNFSRLFTKGVEHTWGEDVKTWLADETNWKNTDFEAHRKDSNFQKIEYSWLEQENWAINFPLEALPNNTLKTRIQNELNALTPKTYNASSLKDQGFNATTCDSTTVCGASYSRWRIDVDATSGAITNFVDLRNNQKWADPQHPLGLLQYITYSQADYDAFISSYSAQQPPPDWFMKDFGKPGLGNTANPAHNQVPGRLVDSTLYIRGATGNLEGSLVWRVQLVLNGDSNVLHTDFGAPADFWIQLDISGAVVNFTVTAHQKTATRLPEAMFLSFNPIPNSPSAPYPYGWGLDKLSYWVDPLYVQTGGAQRLHGVTKGVRYASSSNTTLLINTLDAPVVSVGAPSAFPTPTDQKPDVSYGIHYLLWDNTWGTNYVMWWPYLNDAQYGDLQFRFSITPQ